jgi:6-pyruvoyltetrahydropterin/6-carboxytetrahydropterin synthase
MHKITRRLEFCYGHRLLDYDGKCAHPHGHNAVVEVEMGADDLDGRGMVCDFAQVKSRLMEFIEAEIDHRMILRRDDPLVDALRTLNEPVFILDENPTAENLARLIFRKAREVGLPVLSVRLWETRKCSAQYSEEEGLEPPPRSR